MEQYGKQGLKVLIFPGFFIRQEVLLRQRMVLENRLLDMVDRVHEADTLLYTVGLPWARGGDPSSAAWNVSWENWRGMLNLFDDHASQRAWYREETLLEIEESIPTVEQGVAEDGTTKIETSYVRAQRTVRQDTLDALRVVDAHMLQSKDKPKGWEPTRFIKKTVIPVDPSIERLKRLVGYDPVAAEESIRLWGNEMLMWSGVVLNRSIRKEDVPSQTGDIIHMGAPPMMQTNQRGPAGQSIPPDWSVAPGDKEQR
jgi:hypothetical protein